MKKSNGLRRGAAALLAIPMTLSGVPFPSAAQPQTAAGGGCGRNYGGSADSVSDLGGVGDFSMLVGKCNRFRGGAGYQWK